MNGEVHTCHVNSTVKLLVQSVRFEGGGWKNTQKLCAWRFSPRGFPEWCMKSSLTIFNPQTALIPPPHRGITKGHRPCRSVQVPSVTFFLDCCFSQRKMTTTKSTTAIRMAMKGFRGSQKVITYRTKEKTKTLPAHFKRKKSIFFHSVFPDWPSALWGSLWNRRRTRRRSSKSRHRRRSGWSTWVCWSGFGCGSRSDPAEQRFAPMDRYQPRGGKAAQR